MKQKSSILYKVRIGCLLMAIVLSFFALRSVDELKNIKPVAEFKASDAMITSLALSNKGDFLAIGTNNSSGGKSFWGVALWDKNEWKGIEIDKDKFNKHKINLSISKNYTTQELAVSEDDKIIIGQSDDYIWKWDIANKQMINFDQEPFLMLEKPRIERVKIIPSKNLIIVNQNIAKKSLVYKYTSAKIFDLNSGKLINKLKGAPGHLSDLAIDPNDTRIAGVINDGSVVIWDFKTGDILKNLNVKEGYLGSSNAHTSISRIALSDNYLALYQDNDIKLMGWDYRELKQWEIGQDVTELTISPNQKYIIFREHIRMGIIEIGNVKITRFKISEEDFAKEWPRCFIISNDSKQIIVGNDDGVVRVFDIQKIIGEKPIKTLPIDLDMARNALMNLSGSLVSLSYK